MLVEELAEFDGDYYFRVHPHTQYTFYGDIDGIDDFELHQKINFFYGFTLQCTSGKR